MRRHAGPEHHRPPLSLLLALAAAALAWPPGAAADLSGLGLSVTPGFQSPVTVGQQDQPALVRLVNLSVGPRAVADTVTVSNLRINPGCADSMITPGLTSLSPCRSADPRPDPALPILDLDDTSTAATTCPGAPFVISGPDAEGDYAFTPTTGPLTLAPIGQPGVACEIHFTFDVVQAPTDGLTVQAASVLGTSPSYGAAPQTGVSRVVVTGPPPTTAPPTTTTTTAPVPVRVLPAVVTTVPASAAAPRGGIAATGGEDMLVPGLALMVAGLLGLWLLRWQPAAR